MQRAAYEALQIAGGNGYMKEFPYERFARDARILPIFEGTNEILRLYIALSGLKGVGASLKELQAAVNSIFNDPIKGFGLMTGYAERRIAQATGFGADRILRQLGPELQPLAKIYEKYASELAAAADALLRKHGKKVADLQHMQKRIADLVIDLFVGLCVLSRADALVKSDPANAETVIAIARSFTRQARRRMARNVRAFEHNEDPALEHIAGAIIAGGAYPWDVI
jgi:acyl-CoA dehydrogenase family protein 9